MIMRTALTFAVVWCIVLGSAAATTTAATEQVDETDGQQHQNQSQEVVDTIIQQFQKAVKDPSGEEIKKLNVTDITTRMVRAYVTPAVCYYTPEFCQKNHIHSRGIQSYLATAGTMFAGTLGVMMSKITILIVLSLVSMIVGKMLLFYAFLTSKHHHHHGHHDHVSHYGHHIHPHHHGYHHGYHHKHSHGHHHHVPYVKYTKDKYYIKHTPSESSHDALVESSQPSLSYQSPSLPSTGSLGSSGVSYYKR